VQPSASFIGCMVSWSTGDRVRVLQSVWLYVYLWLKHILIMLYWDISHMS
jgi:hypothetical protein